MDARRIVIGMLLMALVVGPVFGRGDVEDTGTTTESREQDVMIGVGEPIQYGSLTAYQSETGKTIDSFDEAPMLARMVSAGTLPAVTERLPTEPAVILPTEEIGQYGGTWERVFLGPSDMVGMGRIVSDSLIRWSPDASEIVPNVAMSWEVQDGGRTFLFTFREGMKWSDGAPFSADDLLFWFEDMINVKEISRRVPSWFKVKGQEGKLEKLDEQTIRISFPEPYGYFVRLMAYRGNTMFFPKHYLQQFHPKYTDEATLASRTKEAGFEEWKQLFADRKNQWVNTELPAIGPWVATTDRATTRFIMERNPYYWKVDVEGNQLPYVDRVAFDLVESAEVANIRAIAGELDMQFRHMNFADFSLLMEGREGGDYRVMQWTTASGAQPMLLPNQDQKDPVLRALIQDVRFRRALSVAIDRDEINKLVYLGLGQPRQATVIEQSVYYKPEFGNAHTQYDVEMANGLLDEMGLTARSSDGFRQRPDGETLSLTIDVPGDIFGPWQDVSALVAEYWNKIGIKAVLNVIDRSLMVSRSRTDEFEVAVWGMDSALDFLLRARYWIPQSSVTFAPLQYKWTSSGGESGVEPGDDMKRVIELYSLALATPDEAERLRLAHEMLELHAENVWVIGTVGMVPTLGVVKNDFRNVPETAVTDYTVHNPGNTHPSQYFFKQ